MLGQLAVFEGEAGQDETSYRWVHVRRNAEVEAALIADPEMPEFVRRALLEEDTLPRAALADGHILLILRGVGQGAPDDLSEMPSLRFFISAKQVVSVELVRLKQVDEMIDRFRAGQAPASASLFVLDLVRSLRHAVEPVLDQIDARVSELEVKSLRVSGGKTSRVGEVTVRGMRLSTLQLSRFMAPQGHAIEVLTGSGAEWLKNKRRLREEAAAYLRIGADLESVRARAQILAEDELKSVAARTNRTILLLSVVSVVFLPLTFLTGLFGVNLAGIPAADRPWAFAALMVLLVVVAGIAAWLARRLIR